MGKKTSSKKVHVAKRLPSDSGGASKLTFMRLMQGLFLIAAVSVISYLMMRGTLSGATTAAATENQTARKELTSISQASMKSDKSATTVNINTPTGVATSDQKSLMDDVQFATKGDGNIRGVKVDGKSLDSALVKLAMFDNHDFVPRDETKIGAKPKRFDIGSAPQRSHFRKMTYPLVTERGPVGTDTMVR